MNVLMRLITGSERRRRERYPDYAPQHWGTAELGEVPVQGRLLAAGNTAYFEAVMDYPMGPELYRNIALDRTHRVKLMSKDTGGFVANRKLGHRYEPVYRIALYLNLGTDAAPAYAPPQLVWALASQFDTWLAASGARPVG